MTPERLEKIRALNEVAAARGQTLAQLAIAWVLRHPGITSALVGASRVEQIDDAAGALSNLELTSSELERIDEVLGSAESLATVS